MRGRRGRLVGKALRHVTRWGMAAVAAAMVATASGSATLAGAGAAAHTQPDTATSALPARDPVLLPDGGLEGFDGWQIKSLPTWFSRPAAPPAPTKSAIPSPTPPIVAALGESGIPEVALRAYVAAARSMAVSDPSCHLSWSVIAAIGRVESNHGRFGGAQLRADGSTTIPIRGIPLDGRPGVARILDTDNGVYDGDTVYDRAVGPMQFLPSTWPFVAADGNGDGTKDPNNIFDAALGAARYLCAGDADLSNRAQLVGAVMRYNHSAEYVTLVLALAAAYQSGHATLPSPGPVRTAPPVRSPALPPATVGHPPGLDDLDQRHLQRPPSSGGRSTGQPSTSPGGSTSPSGTPSGSGSPTPSDSSSGGTTEPPPSTPPSGDPSDSGTPTPPDSSTPPSDPSTSTPPSDPPDTPSATATSTGTPGATSSGPQDPSGTSTATPTP